MKAKFTKASKRDSTKVTVTLAQFEDPILNWLRNGDQVTIYVDGVPTIFTVNRVRNGKARTAATYGYPRHLRLPSTGRPVYAKASGVF